MHLIARLVRRTTIFAALLLFIPSAVPVVAQSTKPRLHVEDYVIDAELLPKTHKLVAKARVSFTTLDDLTVVVFELHNGLRPTKITNEKGQALSAERVTADSTLRISLPDPILKGEHTVFTFDYEGLLSSADDSPVEGLRLASINEDTTILHYAGRWFPVSGYGVNRFTATIHLTVPQGMKVIGSGVAAPSSKPPSGKSVFAYIWDKPSFPGTIIAGNFEMAVQNSGGVTIRTFFKPEKKDLASAYAETAGKEIDFFSSLYGPAPSNAINIVELPEDTLPIMWAPEIAGLAAHAIDEKTNYRLLANAIAHQWWGVMLSPSLRSDFWITEGGARYSEVRYVESVAGRGGFEEATKDMAVGALAYDTIPLSSVGKLDMFSPEFQSLVTDKGGMIFHMLRWDIGDAAFDKAMHAFLTLNTGKSVTAETFRQATEDAYGDKLTSFYAQWLDGTGAPEFKNKYTVYRVKKGFHVVGEVTQDLDLFRMPMEVRVDTDGQPELKRIVVVGTRSPYSIESFGKPRRIVLDPNNWVLKNTGDLRVRVAVLRGQQLAAQGDYPEALKEYNKALEANNLSSLTHYRIAEVFFQQRNYQSSANSYRESLNGDGEPKWTEVWSHVQLGKIFDTTGQRERAVAEYRQAVQTNDNTQGALDEARKYLEKPYERARPATDQ